MRRLLLLLASLIALPIGPSARAQAAADFEAAIAASLDSIYMLGVARRAHVGPEVFEFVGTGWVIAEGKLATNAHVAESLLESAHEGRLVAKRSWSDRDELSLSATSIRIHPAYGPWNARLKRVVVRKESEPGAARSISFIPIADVAIVEVEAGNTARPLVLADPAQVEPVLSEAVVYLGFPHENISGFPTLHAVPGHVTAKTDFFFQRSTWLESYLIHYCGPVVGGASGSPMLNRAGQVIGLISAAENNLSANGERTSFGFAYGQRVDLVRELLRDDFALAQARRDGEWSHRLASLLIPPEELLDQLALQQSTNDGVAQLSSSNTVTRRQVIVTQSESAKLQVTLEPGLRYGFMAAAHDGSDVDAQVVARESEEVLGVDVQGDYFPCVWVGPFDQRVAVSFEVAASERLLADTTCSLHVYKYEPRAIELEEEDDVGFFQATHLVDPDAAGLATWRFQVEAGVQVMFSAETAQQVDIDLLLALDGTIVTSDESPDAVPIVMYTTPSAGTLELRLRVPSGVEAGAEIELKGLLFEGPKPVQLGAAGGGDRRREFTRAEMLAFLDQLLADVWKGAGAEGETVAEDVRGVEGTFESEFTIPAGAIGVFIAVAPHGEDIDMELLVEGVVVAQDVQADSSPIAALAVSDVERKVVMRVIEHMPDANVGQMAYRFALLRSK